jgi:hypothetical protein
MTHTSMRIATYMTAPHMRLCACACAIGRTRIRADTCEPFPSASTAGGSARRRSSRRRRSARTSARGTPRQSPHCMRYAPPFRPGGAPPQAGRARRVVDAAQAVVCGGAADARAGACTDVWARACTGVHGCGYSCAQERQVVCMHVYVCICMH